MHQLEVENRTVITQEMFDWNNATIILDKVLTDYDWKYRKDICSKCSFEQQKKRKCIRFNEYKKKIQETHCRHLINARTRKFGKLINSFLCEHPLIKKVQ